MKDVREERYLGKGQAPFSLSSAPNFCKTSLQRASSTANTAVPTSVTTSAMSKHLDVFSLRTFSDWRR
jgi:hypothetical protein